MIRATSSPAYLTSRTVPLVLGLRDQSTNSRYLEVAYLMAARPQEDGCLDLLVTGDNLYGSGKQLAFIDGCGQGDVSRRSRQ